MSKIARKPIAIPEGIKFSMNANMIDIDGIRVEFKKGWGLLRASNTSPFLVLRFEAETEEELAKIKEIFYLNLKEIEPETDRF